MQAMPWPFWDGAHRGEDTMIEVKEYRGHIRNWQALCRELGVDPGEERKAREEAILCKAYETWGTDMGNHLHGMFALALWDPQREELFCLRDPFGTKPFYYYETGDHRLLYGTKLSQILDREGFVKKLNPDMLQLYLTLTYGAGEDTFFAGVKKLLPGRWLRWRKGRMEIGRYWAPRFRLEEGPSLEDWAQEIHTTLEQIMKEIKTPEEKAESFLSGGVDSSYVLAMSDAREANTCGYREERFDESVLAAETARILGRKLHRLEISPEDYFGAVPEVMRGMEQPLGDASAIVFALGCKAAAAHTRLCYSGEGADEFFGGYNMYRNAARYGDRLSTFYVGNTNIMKEEEKQGLLKAYQKDLLPIDLTRDIYRDAEGQDPLTQMSNVDIQLWLEGDIYLNVDKMSEAAGLEVRMPLTDRRIFDIAARMPSRFKVDEEQNKVAFRKAASKVLPREVAYRKKLGFIVPIRVWMADPRYNGPVRETLFSERAAQYFRMEAIRGIWDAYIGGDSDNWRKLWTLYTFLVWEKEYL